MGRATLMRFRSAAVVMAAVFVPVLLAAQAPVRPLSPADRPSRTDTLPDLLVEVMIERGLSQSVLALQQDTVVYLPFRTVLALAELRVADVAPGRQFTARFGDGTEVGVLTEGRRAHRGGLVLPWEAEASFWRGDELYVRLDLLSQLLGVEAVMMWSDLIVRVSATDGLPVVQRVARERRRAAMLRETEAPPPPVFLRTRSRLVDGLAVDWALTAATRDPRHNNGLTLGIGATVLGGGLDVQSATVTVPSGTTSTTLCCRTTTTTLWQWNKAWTDRTWLRQVRLGDIATGGERPFGIKGVEVSNRPFLRDPAFAFQDLSGRLPAGWEIEVYRGGELVGYQPVPQGGAYAIGVPVVYGQNPLETVAFGPNGEVRRSERTFVVGFDRLPARRFEYSVSGGECQGTRCDAASNLDLRWGVTRRLTMQAGADRFWRSGVDTLPGDTVAREVGDLLYPYGRATVSVTRPIAVTAEAVGSAFLRGRVDVDPDPDFHLDASYLRFDRDTTVIDPLICEPGSRWAAGSNLFWRPGVLGEEFYAQASLSWLEREEGRSAVLRASATGRWMGVRLSVGGRVADSRADADTTSHRVIGASIGADGVVTAAGPLRNTLFAASVERPDLGAGGMRWSAGIGRQLLRLLRLDLGVQQDPGAAVRMDITLQLATPWLRATSRNTVQRGSEVNGTQLLEGTLLWDRRTGRLGAANGRNLGRAGIAGEVFLDANGNGRRDGGETVLPGVLVRVGSDAVISDSSGRFSVWDLVPFTDALIEVDTLALENPLWVPTVATARVVPVPNSFRFVDIPIRQGGEIAGRVELNGEPLPGATLVLREEATGRLRRIATFTDATFYLMRLPPGRYTLAPAEGLLEQLHVRAAVVEFEIGGAGLLRYDDLVVRLVRE